MARLKVSDFIKSEKAPVDKTDMYMSLSLPSRVNLKNVARALKLDAEEISETINTWKQDSAVLNQLCEVLSDAVIRVDGKGLIFEFNEAACSLFHTTPAYMLGKNISVLLYTDWISFLENFDEHQSFEHMITRLDGSSLLVSTALTRVGVTDGEYILVIRDITQRVKSEQDILILSAALNQASDVIIITNSLNKIIFVNNAFVKHTGYTEQEAMGQDPKFLKSGQTPRVTYDAMWGLLREKRTWEGVVINKCKDGRLVEDYMIVTPVMNGDPVRPAFYISVKRTEWCKPYETDQSNLKA